MINKNILDFFKILLRVFFVYVFLVVTLYFLMGEQLHYRNSRGNIKMPEQSFSLVEINKDTVLEQRFSLEIQRLFELSVKWSALNRTNSGIIQIQIIQEDSNALLAEQKINAEEIFDGKVTTINFAEPIENIFEKPLLIRITSNSESNSAAAVLLNSNEENCFLQINNNFVSGSLCFAAVGQDYIWTGLHYWDFALLGFLIIASLCTLIYIKVKRGQRSYILSAIYALKKYWFLIEQLVARDFKTKYKRSFFGILWSFFNPLLTSMVLYIVFSNLFRYDLAHYPVYLISGVVMFNFFSECSGMCLSSIVGNAALITKVYVPKYVYPLTRTMSSGINLLIAFVPVFIIALVNGLWPTKAWILIIFSLTFLLVFCFGLGLLLSSLMVFFRDTQFLWGVITMMWMYMTPVFYPLDILPENLLPVLKLNPLYYYIDFVRTCIIGGISPEPIMYLQCVFISLLFLVIGGIVFKKTQDNFVLYL